MKVPFVDLKTQYESIRDEIEVAIQQVLGWNARMDGLQGAILSVKLKRLAHWNEARRKNAQLYNELLSNVDGVFIPREADYAKHIYHIYAIRVQNRDALINALAEKGISCGIHYPVPVHLQEAYHFLELGKGSFPIAEKCAEELVSLPMYPELTKEQIEYVTRQIKNIFSPNNINASYIRHYTLKHYQSVSKYHGKSHL